MPDLISILQAPLAAAFEKLGLEPVLGAARRADRPDLGDFQCNGALAGAKKAQKPPRELAQMVVEQLAGNPLFSDISIAGPGFINLRLADTILNARANDIAGDARNGASKVEMPRNVIVDYAGPNIAKPMHVGHLRATIIGDSIKRLFRFRGDQVWGDAHFGDWGFQIGLLISALEAERPDLPFFTLASGPYPSEPIPGWGLAELEAIYPRVAARAKEDPIWRDKARKATAELQAGRPGFRAIWQNLREQTMANLKLEFRELGVDFDLWNGESDADPLIPDMIADLRAKGLLVADQGAEIVAVAQPGDKKSIPPLIVVSSEGSSMYGTTDLATLVQRKRDQDPDLVLYCVDQRQADHFEQVFRAATLAGYFERQQMEHLGFGTMNGADGKPFKTREGGVMPLRALIEQTRHKARERVKESGIMDRLGLEEGVAIANKVANAAIKFADLSSVRTQNYVFDLDQFMSFEGRTGPYLLYAAVRIQSLLRRAEEAGQQQGPILITDKSERDLILIHDQFDQALRNAYEERMPHHIAEFAYNLAQGFSSFYAACPIQVETDADKRASRLRLSDVTLRQLRTSLELLGIDIPARM